MSRLSKPTTTICLLCSEEVDPNGDWRTTIHLDGKGTAEERYIHAECSIRSAVGGIGHLENHAYWCKQMHDPDGGRTYRQSAREVRRWIKENGVEAAVNISSD